MNQNYILNILESIKDYENNIWNKEYDKFNGEYSNRWIGISGLKESESIAIQDNSLDSFSDNCFVEIAMPILNNKSSYVHNLIPLDKLNATKSSSLICAPRSSFALGINSSYFSNGIKVTLSNNNDCNSIKSSLDNLDFSSISSLCFVNSSFNFIGANISKESLKIIGSSSPAEINVLNRILESITTSIYTSPFFFNSSCIEELTLSASSLASCSVNLDFATSFLNFSNASLVFSCLNNSCLANSDQTIQTNLDSLIFNSSSIANVTDAIYILPCAFSSSNFSNSAIFSLITLRTTSATLTSGNVFLNLANTSSGMCTVILNDFAILIPCSIYFNRSNYSNIYKSFAEKDLSDFSLNKITDVYSEFNSGKEIYFLNEDNQLIRVKSITKEKYNGKIYDVYVENYMILVRRNNWIILLLRNSNFGNFTGGLTSGGNLKLSANINLTMNGGNQIGSNITCVQIKGATSILEVC